MPRILCRTLHDQRHGRRRRREHRTESPALFHASSGMNLTCGNDKGMGAFFGFGCWSTNNQDSEWKCSSTTVTPSTSPSTSATVSPSDSSADLSKSNSTRKTVRLDPFSMERKIFSSVAANRYISSSMVETEGETWGHFVDVDEEEEKIVRHSRILSRGSSFGSNFGYSGHI